MAGRQGRLAVRAVTIAAAAIMGTAGQAAADTLLGALAQAYQVNPQLNAQRAIVRQTDEGVPQALSDYRPRVNVNAGVGNQVTSQETAVGPALTQKDLYWTAPRSIGITAQQTFSTASRPPTEHARPKATCSPRARPCG